MINDIKTNALLETARAYMRRGAWVQYDQRCMDRITQLSPRRAKLLPPEAATEQSTLFLDCSSFIGAVYYQTFGYELESDLTWHMIDIVPPRIFFYELTHNETDEEKEAIKNQITGLLIPGDVIVYDRYVGSGHTELYMGDGVFYHCTPLGRPDSYDYENNKSREYPDGGLFTDDFEKLFSDTKIFKETVRRIAVLRPLERMGNPTDEALKRLNEANGLVCSVTASHFGGRCIFPGEDAVYTLNIRNTTAEEKQITADFSVGGKTDSVSVTITPDSEENVIFTHTPSDYNDIFIKTPVIRVCGINIYVHPIITGKRNSISVTDEVKCGIEKGISAYEAAATAYRNMGKSVKATEKELLFSLFYLHDNPGGDVLSRRPQNPASDNAVYSLFGGRGVTTPEIISRPHIRTTKITGKDLMPGDIIVTADDACFGTTHSYYYTGQEILSTEKEKDIDRLTDSLFGQFCFIIIRLSDGVIL